MIAKVGTIIWLIALAIATEKKIKLLSVSRPCRKTIDQAIAAVEATDRNHPHDQPQRQCINIAIKIDLKPLNTGLSAIHGGRHLLKETNDKRNTLNSSTLRL